jgi:hypothetical protein
MPEGPTETGYGSEQTFWSGEPANWARGTGVIASDIPAARTWPARTKGERIPVVRVFYAGEHFDLDNDKDRAWLKVTAGHGSPRFGHRSVTLEVQTLEPDSWEPVFREWAQREGLNLDD